MWTLILGYLLIAGIFVIEHRFESARGSTALQTAADDRGSTRLLFIVYLVNFLSPLWLLFDIGSMPVWLGIVGLGWILGGILLLAWTLFVNTFYIRALATTDEQYICTDGPYKIIRHPGYAGFLTAWIGFGLATQSWLSLLTVVVATFYGYHKRTEAEEQMMLDRFGVDYQQYVNESSRLIPICY